MSQEAVLLLEASRIIATAISVGCFLIFAGFIFLSYVIKHKQ